MGKSNKKSSDTEEEYVVEAILGVKVEGKKTLYKIKWEGYPVSQCTWEPSTHLSKSLIRKYEDSVSKGVSFTENASDESSDDESVKELKMTEILESRKEDGGLQYHVEFSDGSTKWLAAKKVGNKSLIKVFNSKQAKTSSRKRVNNSSQKESDNSSTSKKRNVDISSLNSSVKETPITKNKTSVRKSSRNSGVSTADHDIVNEERFDAPLSISNRNSKSKSVTPVTARSVTRKHPLSKVSTSSKRSKNTSSEKLSDSNKKKKNQKPKVKADETNEGVYTIEKIVDHRIVNGVKEFRVRWENYPPEEDTWQTIDTFDDPNFVAEYEKLATEEIRKLRESSDSDNASNATNESFLQRLMRKTRKGITYKDDEIAGILSKHFNDDGDGFYLVRLASNEVIYMCPDDVPVKFVGECLYADKKRVLAH